MLERICIDNYKRLVNFELPLQALSLLLGRNGMGKTAVLDVAFGVRRLLSGAARGNGCGCVSDADAHAVAGSEPAIVRDGRGAGCGVVSLPA